MNKTRIPEPMAVGILRHQGEVPSVARRWFVSTPSSVLLREIAAAYGNGCLEQRNLSTLLRRSTTQPSNDMSGVLELCPSCPRETLCPLLLQRSWQDIVLHQPRQVRRVPARTKYTPLLDDGYDLPH